jgi:hypothetical protein
MYAVPRILWENGYEGGEGSTQVTGTTGKVGAAANVFGEIGGDYKIAVYECGNAGN